MYYCNIYFYLACTPPTSNQHYRVSTRTRLVLQLLCFIRKLLSSFLPIFSTACKKSLDVGLIIDGSGSVGRQNFGKALQFLSDLVGHLSVSPQGTHVGAVVYNSVATLKFNLAKAEYHSLSKLQDAIKDLDYPGGGTRTDLALQMAADSIFSSAGGDRADAANVLVILTDGKTSSRSAPYKNVLKPLQVSRREIWRTYRPIPRWICVHLRN